MADKGFTHEQTAVPIAIGAAIGIALAAAVVWGFNVACAASTAPVCGAAIDNPPWTVLTAIVAGPSALLTWYWRTAHKKRDIADASRAQVAQRFATAVELIDKGGLTTIGAIYALEQIAKDSPGDHWTVVETLAAFVRNVRSSTERTAQVQAAITVLGRRRSEYDPDEGVIDLRGAPLWAINFDGLNFAGANFDLAHVNEATFFGTDLSGAQLERILGYWTEEDDYVEQQENQYADNGGPGRFNDQTRGAAERAILKSQLLKNVDEAQQTATTAAAPAAATLSTNDGKGTSDAS